MNIENIAGFKMIVKNRIGPYKLLLKNGTDPITAYLGDGYLTGKSTTTKDRSKAYDYNYNYQSNVKHLYRGKNFTHWLDMPSGKIQLFEKDFK